MTSLNLSIWTQPLVILCQSWPPPRAPLSGGRSCKPCPVSGLRGWTMGKDKPLTSRPPRVQHYWLFLSPLFSLMFVCVCVSVCICWRVNVFAFSIKRKTQKEIQRVKEKDKRCRASMMKWPEERWDHFRWDYTPTPIHQLHCPQPYSREQDIAAPCSLFTMWSQACWVRFF